ncbi:MED1 family protein [Megaselia abdita]
MSSTGSKMGDLMERLRVKNHSQRSFVEISKVCRMTLLDKRYALDAVEKANLQKCLDTLQNCIKVTTRLVECIKVTSRQLGLKFTDDPSALFISSDMFYLEIIIDRQNGTVNDVKIHHECNQMESCKELIASLQKGDFQDFTLQLEGLQSIYQLNAEQKIKSKAYPVLRSMELDLYHLFQSQNFTNPKDLQRVILESNVGVAVERRGGHPMKLIYFIPPYDLICDETKTMKPLDTELLIMSKGIGVAATVNLEASNSVKLQITPTLDFKKGQPASTPLTPNNSTILPAHFVLRLEKPIPVFDSILHYMNIPTDSSPKATGNMIKMIVDGASKGEIISFVRGLPVCLPDQNHCYFFTDARKLKATMVSSIPFTEPLQVPNIISLLRKQALFQTLISSCVRPQSRFNVDDVNTVVIEVNAASIQQITVAFQHPYEESMAMIEIDLRDVANVTCQVYSLSSQYKEISSKLSKVLQVCLSIPVTVRALLKMWEIERSRAIINSQATPGTSRSSNGGGNPDGNFNLNDPGGRTANKNGRVFFEGGKSQKQTEDFCNSPRIEDSGDSTSNSLGGMNVNSGTGVAAAKNSVSITPIPLGSTISPTITTATTGITITPVNMTKKSESRRNSVDKEKKRKKRRDESPMGPPEKIMNLPSSGPSPKHSPAYTSPKHPMNSPKSPFPGTQSPKHGSSGKPSMSTLKNATNSSPKSGEKVVRPNKSTDTSREMKIKNASVKLKSMEQSFSLGELTVSSITDDATMQSFQNDLFSGSSANKPKKCSLSAVIDKLKSAQDPTVGAVLQPGTSQGQEDNEYMIKPSEDGMKITINKTKMAYGTPNSPKKHTGLKPGVNSGPSMKKFSTSSSSTKHAFQKSNSSGSLPSAPIPQPTNPADVMKLLQFSTPNGDALMKSFQIPKLSRNNNTANSQDSKNSIRPISAPSTPVPSFKPSPNPHSMD